MKWSLALFDCSSPVGQFGHAAVVQAVVAFNQANVSLTSAFEELGSQALVSGMEKWIQ